MKQNYGDQRSKNQTRRINKHFRSYLEREFPSYGTRKSIDVSEVVDHALLDLIDRPNPHMSFSHLLGMTAVYLETVGSAFWYKSAYLDSKGNALRDVNGNKLVAELWLIPPQTIDIIADDDGHLIGYTQKIGSETEDIDKEDLIHFKHFNPADPYTGFGISPLRAVWQRVMLLREEQASWGAILQNAAVPSALVTPPGPDGLFTKEQAERIDKQVNARFRLGKQGGIWVVQDSMDYKPISTPPKDLSAITMYEQIKECIANAYAIPLPLLRMDETTGEASNTAERAFQKNCLRPRVRLIFETMTRDLCPDSRLFFSCDDVLEPDRAFELQRSSALFQSNAITVNEYREDQGLDPVVGGDKFLYQILGTNAASSGTMGTLPDMRGGKTVKKKSVNPPDPQPLAEALQGIFRQLRDAYLTGRKAVAPEWADLMGDALSPILRAYYQEGSNEIRAELGVLPPLPVNSLNQAVNQAIFHLADSTLATTELEVEAAREATREAIRQGLNANEANIDLAARIQAIFTDLEERRCFLIADTEATRAKSAGELLTIQEAGVDCKKVWLPDALACDVCRGLDGATRELSEPFAVIGSGPYSVIDHPPLHPNCRCSLQYQFPEDAD
ncbi:phage portal protein [Fimbriiglobus ruber]|uniref:Phage portal protein n=1 Tax=Fimbriiglobus ruber TaxID=1908690 RepID=A0A225DYJ5_9BACT|nr:phage portal protein [Fimbriiglobus ruber]OWK46610.1 phage portal protein [Fimbriiglobus ruber]